MRQQGGAIVALLINDHFDVAHLVGHTSLDHLAFAMSVYDKAKQSRLLDPSQYSWPDCLQISGILLSHRAEERKSCVQAVVLFQAMMEKVPHFVPDIGLGLEPTQKEFFAGRWTDLISQISGKTDRAKATAAFDTYKKDFYVALRNPIIHGKTAADVQKVEQIRLPEVYEGMRQGWRAFDYLLTEAFSPKQSHQPSWEVMCKAHELPSSINPSDFPNLADIAGQFSKKHLDGARSAAGD